MEYGNLGGFYFWVFFGKNIFCTCFFCVCFSKKVVLLQKQLFRNGSRLATPPEKKNEKITKICFSKQYSIVLHLDADEEGVLGSPLGSLWFRVLRFQNRWQLVRSGVGISVSCVP